MPATHLPHIDRLSVSSAHHVKRLSSRLGKAARCQRIEEETGQPLTGHPVYQLKISSRFEVLRRIGHA